MIGLLRAPAIRPLDFLLSPPSSISTPRGLAVHAGAGAEAGPLGAACIAAQALQRQENQGRRTPAAASHLGEGGTRYSANLHKGFRNGLTPF